MKIALIGLVLLLLVVLVIKLVLGGYNGCEEVVYVDNYTMEGNSNDGVTWVGWQLDMKIDYCITPPLIIDGECYRYRGYPFNYEKCYFKTSSLEDLCDADDGLISCSEDTDCETGLTAGEQHSGVIDTSSATAYTGDSTHSSYLISCGTQNFGDYVTENDPNLYVINKKRFHCVNSSHYTYQGWYGSGWINYGGGACSETCDDSSAQNYTNPDDTINNPCVGNETDLAIVNIIPIQVVSGVDMVKDKSGYVVVNVSNTGNNKATVNVSAWFEGIKLNISKDVFTFLNINPKSLSANSSTLFIFDFTPHLNGTNKIINSSIKIIN
ncbi:hypothetical protein AYK26_06405 [Euryarchaeota archaeon SM23-78]|nr:MAG: hypothetical protein AYK26_06405 [Euryarchaeota archaeon SM23-78]MBW3001206.1 hypothetical protein [Candidatus Woesearchaeota archaeon]